VDVVLEGSGKALVSWIASDRDEATILVRRVTGDGQLGASFRIARTAASRESGFPRMEELGDRVLVVWTEAGAASHLRAKLVPRASVSSIPEAASEPGPAGARPLQIGSMAPDYGARTLSGERVSLSSLRGSPVLLNFWATWCEPCRMEIPELAELHRRYAGRGLRVVGVDLDGHRTASGVATFVSRRRIEYAIWLDPDDRASRTFGLTTLPATCLLDRQGRVLMSRTGELSARDPALIALIEGAMQASIRPGAAIPGAPRASPDGR
jgi:thiol-disulfide isomerase/thioredoxin